MEPSSSSSDSAARRRNLLILWFAMTASVGMYGFVAAMIGSDRTTAAPAPGAATPTDLLSGPLALLPYVLPVILLVLGLMGYQAVALKGAEPGRWGEQQARTEWGRISAGLILMLAIFEMNAIAGLVFFFLGSPLEKFWLFALGTLLLNGVALQRLLSTWPSE